MSHSPAAAPDQAHSSSSPPPSAASRKRASRACHHCRIDRVRCSGPPPPCSSCRLRQLDCQFRASNNDRRRRRLQAIADLPAALRVLHHVVFSFLTTSLDAAGRAEFEELLDLIEAAAPVAAIAARATAMLDDQLRIADPSHELCAMLRIVAQEALRPAPAPAQRPPDPADSAREPLDPVESVERDGHPPLDLMARASHLGTNPAAAPLVIVKDTAAAIVVSRHSPQCDLDFLHTRASLPFAHPSIASWKRSLPTLAHENDLHGQALCAAVQTLGTAVAFQGTGSREPNVPYVQIYTKTICLLQKFIDGCSEAQYSLHLATATICLVLTELVWPLSHRGWLTHLLGAERMMLSAGPEAFADGHAFELFTSFRILLLLRGLATRRPTFLAQRDWLRVPFAKRPADPYQQLLSIFAIFPAILYKVDGLAVAAAEYDTSPDHQGPPATAPLLRQVCRGLYERLTIWEANYAASVGPIPYWFVDAPGYGGNVPGLANVLWFPHLNTAMCFVYAWAFQIAAELQIRELDAVVAETPSPPRDAQSEDRPWQPALKIIRSIDFFLQTSMNMFGPHIAMYPFRMAYTIAVEHRDRCPSAFQHCEKLLRVFSEKGFFPTPLFADILRDDRWRV